MYNIYPFSHEILSNSCWIPKKNISAKAFPHEMRWTHYHACGNFSNFPSEYKVYVRISFNFLSLSFSSSYRAIWSKMKLLFFLKKKFHINSDLHLFYITLPFFLPLHLNMMLIHSTLSSSSSSSLYSMFCVNNMKLNSSFSLHAIQTYLLSISVAYSSL